MCIRDRCKGALVTFDDVTEIEDSNIKLDMMLKRLELSRNEISRQNSELKKLAEIDPLTGFYNRRALNIYFNEVFNQTCEQSTDLVCIMLDIDRFKSINDTYGHQVGDLLIQTAARVLEHGVRAEDSVARVGGDEFTIILYSTDEATAKLVLGRLRTALGAYNRRNESLPIRMSLGTATAQEGSGLEEALRRADEAMYQDKTQRKEKLRDT